MSISDVSVTINLTTPVRGTGFGYPLILVSGAGSAIAYTECDSLAEVITAGYASGTKTYELANLIFQQEHAPEKVAVCSATETALVWLGDELNTNKDWRQLILADTETSATDADSISDFIETLQGKLLYLATERIDGEFTAPSNKRTILVVGDGEDAAIVGETAGREVGSFTYKNLILKGVTPQTITSEQLGEYDDDNTIVVVKKAGDIVTSNGVTLSGEYIDIVDSEDYIIQQITYRTQKLLNSTAKIPYDNNGIASLESVTLDVLKECDNNGMIAVNDDGSHAYSVEFKKREDVSSTDIAARKYLGGQFTFKLAGAIHEVEIVGEITL